MTQYVREAITQSELHDETITTDLTSHHTAKYYKNDDSLGVTINLNQFSPKAARCEAAVFAG